jgi:maltose 6'-phosphate phosphatase
LEIGIFNRHDLTGHWEIASQKVFKKEWLMNPFGKNTRLFLSTFAFMFLILSFFISFISKSFAQETGAENIKVVKFLNINLLFSEVDDRNKRLRAIADYLAANQIDVLLLQEVVGGELVGTQNSAEDLRGLLSEVHNLNYFLRTAFETGVPGLLSTANAILSRFVIEFSNNQSLPWVTEEEFLGYDVKLPRNVMLTRLLIPGFGEVDVFNTHLCSRCSPEEREDQLEEVFNFIKKFQNDRGASRPTVLGGDMNFDIFTDHGDEKFLYDKVLAEGFSDAYAKYIIAAMSGRENLETLCENKDNADEHCTVGVSDLDGSNARRIDYIFARGFRSPVHSQVVFNPNAPNGVPPTVSDHAAVVVHLRLPFRGELSHLPLLLLLD